MFLVLVVFISLQAILAIYQSSYTITGFGLIHPLTRPLHVEGKYIKDDLGNTVYLRGVNRAHFTTDCAGLWQPRGGSETSGLGFWNESAVRDHLEEMKNYGFNALRMHCCIEWWKYDMNTTLDGSPANRNYRACVKDVIRIAQEYGIYVIIDWYAVRVGWPPLGQDPLPFPPYSTTDPNGTVISSSQDFINFWVDVATDLREYHNVLFELFNEPHGDATARNTWFNVVQECINAIRNIPCDNIVIVHWGFCGSFQWVADYPLNGTNIVYSNHIYHERGEGPGATIPADKYTYEEIKDVLVNTWKYDIVVNNSYPVLIGEFGAVSEDDVQYQFFVNLLKLMNDWNFSYTAWVWDQPSLGYSLQYSGTYPFSLKRCGTALVDAIASGS
jgi:aryl-phospho-beta-D-glucosidase BglC (GH1 family)